MRDSVVQGLGVVVFVVSAALLTSLGGAGVAASPVTVPLMYLLVRLRPTRPFRVAGIVIGGLTGLEVGVTLAGAQFDGAVALGAGVATMLVVGALFATITPSRRDDQRRAVSDPT
ncbi:hypothetical protein BH24ACT15_BH24ACT15_37430 [soil metagenome]